MVTASKEIEEFLHALEEALASANIDQILDLFEDECYWRDFLTFTWNIITLEGKSDIRKMLKERLEDTVPANWQVDATPEPHRNDGVAEGFIRFNTQLGYGYGHIRIRNGRIFTLLTTMEDLKGHEETGRNGRPYGLVEGAEEIAKPTWGERHASMQSLLGVSEQPYVLIVGGGHSGIILGARLRQHGVPTLIVETNERPGDNWRKRYRTLQLHNPVWENHLPYLPFPENWPVYMSKDKYADWLESYTRIMELNYWGSSEVEEASYDQESQEWEVRIRQDDESVVVRPKQLVIATGSHSIPQRPTIPGQERFAGAQQHSSEHLGPDEMRGKKVVVVGSGTSAHDICAALASKDVDVTMIQRSPTFIVKPRSFNKHTLGGLYSAEAVDRGLDHEKADLLAQSVPYRLFFGLQKSGVDQIREADAEFYKKLEATGFLLDFGPRGSGLFGRAVTGVNNYYIDVGASQMIIDGKIKVESGSGVRELTEDTVLLDDGRNVPADAIIYATGFRSMYGTVAEIISPEVADRIGHFGGIGSGESSSDPGPWEGEIRNMWKPVPHDALWFHSGLIAHARAYSRPLALQLKARMEGVPTPVYGLGDSDQSTGARTK